MRRFWMLAAPRVAEDDAQSVETGAAEWRTRSLRGAGSVPVVSNTQAETSLVAWGAFRAKPLTLPDFRAGCRMAREGVK